MILLHKFQDEIRKYGLDWKTRKLWTLQRFSSPCEIKTADSLTNRWKIGDTIQSIKDVKLTTVTTLTVKALRYGPLQVLSHYFSCSILHLVNVVEPVKEKCGGQQRVCVVYKIWLHRFSMASDKI